MGVVVERTVCKGPCCGYALHSHSQVGDIRRLMDIGYGIVRYRKQPAACPSNPGIVYSIVEGPMAVSGQEQIDGIHSLVKLSQGVCGYCAASERL